MTLVVSIAQIFDDILLMLIINDTVYIYIIFVYVILSTY